MATITYHLLLTFCLQLCNQKTLFYFFCLLCTSPLPHIYLCIIFCLQQAFANKKSLLGHTSIIHYSVLPHVSIKSLLVSFLLGANYHIYTCTYIYIIKLCHTHTEFLRPVTLSLSLDFLPVIHFKQKSMNPSHKLNWYSHFTIYSTQSRKLREL